MAEADPEEIETKSGGGNKLIIILLAVLIVVILAVGITIAILLMKGDAVSPANGQETEQVEEEELVRPDPIHVSLGDKMTVNLADQSIARLLRIEVEVLTYNEEAAEVLRRHNSQVRNDLMLMLTEVDVAEVRTRAGRAALQEEVRHEVNRIVYERAGIEDAVEEVYFLELLTQ